MRELFARDVLTLEQAIQLVQNLDQHQVFLFTRRIDYMDNVNKTTALKT